MADENENQTALDDQEGADDVVIIEEGTESTATQQTPQEAEVVEEKKGLLQNKKKLIIIGGVVFLLLIAAGVGGYIFWKKKHDAAGVAPVAEKKAEHKEQPEVTELEEMIRKATVLYSQGEKEKALAIFEEVSQYSESISQYNLGVAKMAEGAYDAALNHFVNALANKEHQCPSALNAAVCAYNLCDEKKFQSYLALAKEKLPDEIDSPLYSTYYALIHYYQTHYFEALAALTHPTSTYLPLQSNNMKARVGYTFGDIDTTISLLSKENSIVNELPIGLLYAQKGLYDEAIVHLEKSAKLPQDNNYTYCALALANLKAGHYADASKALTEFQRINGNNPPPLAYPIRVALKPSLFMIDAAQKAFKKNLFSDPTFQYAVIFYFAPFKMIDANQIITDIRKGQVGIMKNEPEIAQSYLAKSSLVSKTNISILKAIDLAHQYHLNEAKKILQTAATQTPRHAILHYNLGLIEAQLGDFSSAYAHFIRSYNLDPHNLEAGIFAIMTGKLIQMNPERTITSVKNDLFAKTNTSPLYAQTVALLYFAEGNGQATASWINKSSAPSSPLGEVLRVLTANPDISLQTALVGAKNLSTLLPDDMLASFISLHYGNYSQSLKQIASLGQNLFNRQSLDWRSLYYGSPFIKQTMIDFAFVTGMLPRVEEKLTEQLLIEKKDKASVALCLAHADILLKRFDKADKIYRELIDKKVINDSKSYFLAAIATLGRDNNADAIGFLDLAKYIDPKDDETRFALGLLYLETGHIPAATKSFESIENKEFRSKYFDFVLADKGEN